MLTKIKNFFSTPDPDDLTIGKRLPEPHQEYRVRQPDPNGLWIFNSRGDTVGYVDINESKGFSASHIDEGFRSAKVFDTPHEAAAHVVERDIDLEANAPDQPTFKQQADEWLASL